jgi:hypothetical protein
VCADGPIEKHEEERVALRIAVRQMRATISVRENLRIHYSGGMAERSNAAVLKIGLADAPESTTWQALPERGTDAN